MSKVKELEKQLAEARKTEREEKLKQQLEYKTKKDTFVHAMVNQFVVLNKEMTALKENVFTQGYELHKDMYKIFDRSPKDDQKTHTLQNEDKTEKIVIEHSENLVFTEEANVGIDMMHEVLKSKYESRNKGMYRIIDKLLTRNSKGDYDPKLLVKLRELEPEINDTRFSKAIEILNDSQTVDKTALYVRAYRKNDTGKWKDITLQFSSL